MSPHAQETGTHHIEKSVERKRKKGGGGGRREGEELDDDCSRPRWLKELPTAGPTPHERNATLLRMRFQTDL